MFKTCMNFSNIKMTGVLANTNTVLTPNYPEQLKKIIVEGSAYQT